MQRDFFFLRLVLRHFTKGASEQPLFLLALKKLHTH